MHVISEADWSATLPALPATNVLGLGISAATRAKALDVIEGCIARRDRQYVCVAASHAVLECHADEDLRRIYNASAMITPDGMPLVWLSRLAGHRDVERVYGPDLMLDVCARSVTTGYRHFLYGFEIDGEDVPSRLASSLRERFPGIRIVGTCAAPQRPLTHEEDVHVSQEIDESGADIVWIGLGTPRQERWAASHVGRLSAPVLIGIGAAFDFHSGRKPQAPAWMRSRGLEWAFRLLSEPHRLWKRYLFGNAKFVVLVLVQLLGLKHYALDLNGGDSGPSH